jgi:hypothetical protein
MKNLKYFFIGSLLMLFLSGCLQVSTTVNINKDGSGTIEETVMMKTEMINMMKEFMMSFDSTKSETFNMFNEKELQAKESEYGEGVKYVSGEKITLKDYEGFKVVYSFKDINKIKVNPSPEGKVPFGNELEEPNDKAVDDILKFNFKKGNPSTLVINFPKPKMDNKNDSDSSFTQVEDSTNAEAIEKLKEMFDGMKMAMYVNFNGEIKETDAAFVDGSKVTLMEVDFSEIIKHKDVLEKLQTIKPETMEQFKEAVGDLPGIKVEFKEKVTIKF